MSNDDVLTGRAQENTVTIETTVPAIELEEAMVVFEVLNGTYPGFVLEVPTTAGGLGDLLAGRNPKRALLVEADPDNLSGMLQERFPGRIFEIYSDSEELYSRLGTVYEGFVLLIPIQLSAMAEFLDELFPLYFLVTHIDLTLKRSEVPVRDFAPPIELLKEHYAQFVDSAPLPTPPAIDLDSDLRLFWARHKLWTDDYSSEMFTISMGNGRVVGRS